MKNIKRLLMLILGLAMSSNLLAVDYYVDPSGTDDGSHGSGPGTNAWKSIQYAVTNVSDPTTATIVIHVSGDTYTLGSDDIDINRSFNNLTIQGAGAGTTIVQAETSAGSATNRVFDIYIGNTAALKNMTIRYGKYSSQGGGGIKSEGSLTLENCSIENNQADKGGGIYISNSSTTINNCTISYNSITDATHNGGGVYVDGSSTLTLTNTTISGNSAGSTLGTGGGIHLQNTAGTINLSITNCTIAENTSGGNGKGIYEYASSGNTNNLTLKNCIISNGTSSNYANSGSGTHNLIRTYTLCRDASMSSSGSGNLNNSDPFLSALALYNNPNGTYTHHIASNSPARDAGTSSGAPATDQRTANRNGNVDMGSYEYWSDDGALPVELSSFTATAGNGQVTLKWTTESEIDNEIFILERGTDKENFELLAEIEGQGSTSNRTDYSYSDNSVFNGFTYYYRLSDSDYSGNITCHQTISITVKSLPTRFVLYQNYPNPFNPETTIRFDVPTTGAELKQVKLVIFNSLGQLVTTLYNGPLSGGEYKTKWDGNNSLGVTQPSGVYFIHFQSADFVKTQKMILMR